MWHRVRSIGTEVSDKLPLDLDGFSIKDTGGSSPDAASADLPGRDENHAYIILIVISICMGITCLVTALRFFVRGYILRAVGADDWALLWAWVWVMVASLLICIGTSFGLGQHIWFLSVDQLISISKIAVAQVCMYQLALPSVKAVFLLQYRRVFALPNVQRLCDIVLAFIILFGASQVILSFTFCIPIQYWWDKTRNGHCIDTLTWWHVGSVINIVTDVIIFIIPLALLHTLPLHRNQKIILGIIFGLGFFVCAISVIRITSLRPSLTSPDSTYDISPGIWSVVELNCATICVCIPTLRPLIAYCRCYPWPGTRGAGAGNARRPQRRTSGFRQRELNEVRDLEGGTALGSVSNDEAPRNAEKRLPSKPESSSTSSPKLESRSGPKARPQSNQLSKVPVGGAETGIPARDPWPLSRVPWLPTREAWPLPDAMEPGILGRDSDMPVPAKCDTEGLEVAPKAPAHVSEVVDDNFDGREDEPPRVAGKERSARDSVTQSEGHLSAVEWLDDDLYDAVEERITALSPPPRRDTEHSLPGISEVTMMPERLCDSPILR